MSSETCPSCGTERIVSGPCVFCGHDPAADAAPGSAPAPVFDDVPATQAAPDIDIGLELMPDTGADGGGDVDDLLAELGLSGDADDADGVDLDALALDDAAEGFEEELNTSSLEFGGDDLLVGDGDIAETLTPGEGFENLGTDLNELLLESSEEGEEAEADEEIVLLVEDGDEGDDDGEEEEILIDLSDDDDDEGEVIEFEEEVEDEGEEEVEVEADEPIAAEAPEPTAAGVEEVSDADRAAILAELGLGDDDDDDGDIDFAALGLGDDGDDDDGDIDFAALGLEEDAEEVDVEDEAPAALVPDPPPETITIAPEVVIPEPVAPPTPAFVEEEQPGDDFLQEETGATAQVIPSAIHIDAATQAMLEPNCVLAQEPGVDVAALSAFEQVLFNLVNGKRPNARIAKRCGTSFEDVRIGLALLCDRRSVRLIGYARRKGEPAPEPAAAPPAQPADDGWRMSFDDEAPIAEPVEHTNATPAPVSAEDIGLELMPVEAPAPRPAAPAARVSSPVAQPVASSATILPPTAPTQDGLLGLPGFDEPTNLPAAQPTPQAAPEPEAEDAQPRARRPTIIEAEEDKAKSKPRDVQLYEQARVVEQKGDPEKALELLEEAARLNPKAAPVFNRMGVLLATKLKEPGKGMDMVQKAMELDPHNPTYQKNLGVIVSRMDQFKGKKEEAKGGLMGRLFKK